MNPLWVLREPGCSVARAGLGVWAGADWVFTLLGSTLEGRLLPLDLLISVAAIYFHFQLFTDLARLAERYQPPGAALGRRLLGLRTVQTLILTVSFILGYSLSPNTHLTLPGDSPAGWVVAGLALAGLLLSLMLMSSLFALRKCFLPPEEA